MLVRLASAAALLCVLAIPAGAATAPFATRITREAVTGHRASFRFKAVNGTATGFFCTLYSQSSKVIPEATPCGVPQRYTRLGANTYTFVVYATGPSGTSLSAQRVFTIP